MLQSLYSKLFQAKIKLPEYPPDLQLRFRVIKVKRAVTKTTRRNMKERRPSAHVRGDERMEMPSVAAQ